MHRIVWTRSPPPPSPSQLWGGEGERRCGQWVKLPDERLADDSLPHLVFHCPADQKHWFPAVCRDWVTPIHDKRNVAKLDFSCKVFVELPSSVTQFRFHHFLLFKYLPPPFFLFQPMRRTPPIPMRGVASTVLPVSVPVCVCVCVGVV